MHEKIVL